MRWCLLFAFAVGAFGQASDDQRPRYLPGWPCTGKERSFDPAYAHTAEASGGHLFLFDKSEVSGFSKFALGDLRHKQTVVRAAGKLDSYTDIRVPVDSGVASLFVTVTLQCMQTVLIYDPLSAGVHPEEMGGEDNWFRAGRIAIIPKPQSGVWTVRLVGVGPYFVSVQAEAASGLHNVKVSTPETGVQQEWSVSLNIDPSISEPRFMLINAAGETVQTLTLEPDADSPGRFQGVFTPQVMDFRIVVESRDENGNTLRRVDPRLFEAKTEVR
jgi:hypothetical protein